MLDFGGMAMKTTTTRSSGQAAGGAEALKELVGFGPAALILLIPLGVGFLMLSAPGLFKALARETAYRGDWLIDVLNWSTRMRTSGPPG